jgi:meso-butanediol dehydrogenase/(S,S)-butanediol dehydrogenase/diacetyl reductase
LKSLEGKVAIVTGSGQGVGEGIAMALSSYGVKVALLGRTFNKVEVVASNILKSGGTAIPIECDVKNLASIEEAIALVISEYKGIQILVNNAQEVPLGTMLNVTDEAAKNGWESGPLATLRFMRSCYPHLKGNGSIINLASSSALRPDSAGYGVYAAVKEAIRSMTRTAAVEWGPDNIRVNAIMPLAMSAGMEWWMKERPEEASEFLKTVPLGRVGDCKEDIGEAVCKLLTDDMNYITGSTLMLDGGQAFLR